MFFRIFEQLNINVSGYTNRVKWAYQRLTRGWDDRVIIELGDYLSRMIPIWLEAYKTRSIGFIPVTAAELLASGKGPDEDEILKREWDLVLDEIIQGFEAANQLMNLNLPIQAELRRQEEETFGDRPSAGLTKTNKKGFNDAERQLTYDDILRRQTEEAEQKLDKAFQLLRDHLFKLWL